MIISSVAAFNSLSATLDRPCLDLSRVKSGMTKHISGRMMKLPRPTMTESWLFSIVIYKPLQIVQVQTHPPRGLQRKIIGEDHGSGF